MWKARIMLLACEPLFLRSRDNIAIDDKSGGAVVVECRNAKYPQDGP